MKAFITSLFFIASVAAFGQRDTVRISELNLYLSANQDSTVFPGSIKNPTSGKFTTRGIYGIDLVKSRLKIGDTSAMLQPYLKAVQAAALYAAASHNHAGLYRPITYVPSISDLTQSGAMAGQVIKWNGTAWAPGTDNTGSGGNGVSSNADSLGNQPAAFYARKDTVDAHNLRMLALGNSINSHIANTTNPHSVTKAQVGLSNVPNVDATNPANITQSSPYRFVSDAEKATWNGAYVNSMQVGPGAFTLNRTNGTRDTFDFGTPAVDTAGKWMNDIYRKPGTDSIFKKIGATWSFAYRDSIAGGGGGSGTVTSIAPGYGITGSTITTSGTHGVDTTLIQRKLTAGTNITINGNTISATGGGGGTGGDLLSGLLSTEVSVSNATTLTSAAFGKMHVCTGTSADYTVSLPAASGNAGKLIGFRMSNALTKLVTLDPNASETIDGALTRTLWKNEVAILLCDGTTWTKIAGKSIAMVCVVAPSVNTGTFGAGARTIIPIDAVITDLSGMSDIATSRVYIRRAGSYLVTPIIRFESLSANAGRLISFASLNGSGSDFLHQGESSGLSGGIPFVFAPSIAYYTAGDYLKLGAFYGGGPSAAIVRGSGTTENSSLSVEEKLSW